MEEDRIYYVYDRVCTKEVKQTEILREYGDIQIRAENPSRDRLYHSEFAEAQRRRAAQARKNAPSRPGYTGSNGSGSAGGAGSERHAGGRRAGGTSKANVGASHAYTYRPGAPEGGEAAQEEGRGRFEWFRKLFETLEEKGEEDVTAAKKAAIALRKIKEYRHIIVTVLLLLLVTAFAAFAVYKLFFVIKDVSVTGNELYDEEEILAASAIRTGDNLYSFRASGAESRITFLCPYVKSAEVSRTVPDKVSIAVTEDEAVFRVNVWGDTVLLSAGLRVLEVRGGEETKETPEGQPDGLPAGLIELILPAVDKSVAGRVLSFSEERSERYIRTVLSAVLASDLCKEGMLDQIDLTDEYKITMKACGKYSLKCGDEKDMERKLKFGYATVTSSDFNSELRASIDLSFAGEASILYDYSSRED